MYAYSSSSPANTRLAHASLFVSGNFLYMLPFRQVPTLLQFMQPVTPDLMLIGL
jgi:hypothetical protein